MSALRVGLRSPWGLATALAVLLSAVALDGQRLDATAGDRAAPTAEVTTTPDAGGWVRLGVGAADYAPAGLPDFDQRQYRWVVKLGDRQAWTHDGPVAAAAALWWLDSRYETGELAPPVVSDGFDLVTAYRHFDDHDPMNVGFLVNDLATVIQTNPGSGILLGTCLDDLAAGIEVYLRERADPPRLGVAIIDEPVLTELRDALARSHAVVMLVGFWQHLELTGWQRIGGHYVALEAVDTRIGRVRIADPYRDVAWPASDPAENNDAARVSHDAWMASPSLRPRAVLRLDGYMADAGAREGLLANFQGLNHRRPGDSDVVWSDGATIEAHLDAALVIGPAVMPTNTSTPPPTTPPAEEPPSPTATVSGSVAITPTLTATAMPPPSPQPGEPGPPPGASPPPAPTEAATLTPAPPSPTGTAASPPSPVATEPPPTATELPAATATDPPPPLATDPPAATATAVASPADLCGRVTDAGSGRPLPGAELRLYFAEALRARTRTDLGGRYCFATLPPGAYRVEARASGCDLGVRELRMAGDTVAADFELTCHVRIIYLPMAVKQRRFPSR
jgi:hypothetical protein